MSSKGVFIHDSKNLRNPAFYELKNRKKKILSNSPIKQVISKNTDINLNKKQSVSQVNFRCIYTGRKRGLVRYTKMTRMIFKDSAYKGYIPGIRKSTW